MDAGAEGRLPSRDLPPDAQGAPRFSTWGLFRLPRCLGKGMRLTRCRSLTGTSGDSYDMLLEHVYAVNLRLPRLQKDYITISNITLPCGKHITIVRGGRRLVAHRTHSNQRQLTSGPLSFRTGLPTPVGGRLPRDECAVASLPRRPASRAEEAPAPGQRRRLARASGLPEACPRCFECRRSS